MVINQETDAPSNVLAHARARTVCFRDLPPAGGGDARPPGTPAAPPRLLLVCYDNGTYGILLDGRALPGSPWPEDQLDRCIDAFQNVGRGEATPGAGTCRPGWTEGPSVDRETAAAPRPG